jgi:8-oxo-dGTP pyrophosphatase MutT (NUDIX family)
MLQHVEFLDGPIDSDESYSLSVIRAAGHIVMGRKTRGFGAGKLALPGGKDQYYLGDARIAEQSPAFCAVREIWQETGLSVPERALRLAGGLTIFDEDSEDIGVRLHAVDLPKRAPLIGRSQKGHSNPDLVDPRWVPESELSYDGMPYDYRLWLPHVLAGYAVNLTLFTEGGVVTGGFGSRMRLDPLERSEAIPISPETLAV